MPYEDKIEDLTPFEKEIPPVPEAEEEPELDPTVPDGIIEDDDEADRPVEDVIFDRIEA